MGSMNYLQRVGHSSCIRCNFETNDKMSFAAQDAAMLAHLAEFHPDWQTDGGASILPKRLPRSKEDVLRQAREALEFNFSDCVPELNCGECEKRREAIAAINVILGEPLPGSTVHEPGCPCGFCKMGSTRA